MQSLYSSLPKKHLDTGFNFFINISRSHSLLFWWGFFFFFFDRVCFLLLLLLFFSSLSLYSSLSFVSISYSFLLSYPFFPSPILFNFLSPLHLFLNICPPLPFFPPFSSWVHLTKETVPLSSAPKWNRFSSFIHFRGIVIVWFWCQYINYTKL